MFREYIGLTAGSNETIRPHCRRLIKNVPYQTSWPSSIYVYSTQNKIVGVYFYVRHRQQKKSNFPAQATFLSAHRMLENIKKQLGAGTPLAWTLQNNEECLGFYFIYFFNLKILIWILLLNCTIDQINKSIHDCNHVPGKVSHPGLFNWNSWFQEEDPFLSLLSSSQPSKNLYAFFCTVTSSTAIT